VGYSQGSQSLHVQHILKEVNGFQNNQGFDHFEKVR
jgi:hypothetical protein